MIDYHYFFLIGSVLVAAVSQVLLKKGALHHYDSWIREYLNVRLRVFKYYGTSGRGFFQRPCH